MRGLRLLRDAGMRELNMVGEELLFYPLALAQVLRYCEDELRLEHVVLVRQGPKIDNLWMWEHSRWFDVLEVSCDTFNLGTHFKVGRDNDRKDLERLFQIA